MECVMYGEGIPSGRLVIRVNAQGDQVSELRTVGAGNRKAGQCRGSAEAVPVCESQLTVENWCQPDA